MSEGPKVGHNMEEQNLSSELFLPGPFSDVWLGVLNLQP